MDRDRDRDRDLHITHDTDDGTMWVVQTQGAHISLSVIRPAKGTLPRELHFPLAAKDAGVLGRALTEAAIDAGVRLP